LQAFFFKKLLPCFSQEKRPLSARKRAILAAKNLPRQRADHPIPPGHLGRSRIEKWLAMNRQRLSTLWPNLSNPEAWISQNPPSPFEIKPFGGFC
jgi:hypothetical protein